MCMQRSDDRESVTIDEAAAELHTTPLRVLMLIKEKALAGVLSNGNWSVTRESLDCFRENGADLTLQSSCCTTCSTSGCGCR